MTRILSLLLFLGFASQIVAQKTVHIPNYLQNPNDVNGAQFTWSKTAQSTNFIMIWGNTVGTNPASYPDPDLNFNPSKILDTMEYIYTRFKELEFLDDSPSTNLAQFKIPIVIYGTWGTNGAQGWANGGDADGIIGAFWVHPNAMDDGGVAAHELAHSLQAQNNIDYRTDHGLGNSWQNSGIFWECHANFMRNLLYPKAVTAWGMDVYHLETWGDWKNTYENYALLFAIMESEGIDMVNRLWRESFSYEYPLQAYKRLAGYSQAEFNDSLFHYARRMATYDFNYSNVGDYFRQYRNADLQNWLPTIQNAYSILRPVTGGDPGRYEIPIEQAPEEFSYNVIPLYPNADSCSVIVKFKGHTEANTHTGWRYGFVAALPNGKVSRYSPTYSANTGEVAFRLQGNETRMYLVVMGAPNDGITTNTTNDTWKGYPKHFRFPYELNITGAVPEGYQATANFRAQLRTNGHLHSNGGGWVQNSATVASTVYVGPTAIVRGNSNISGQVRIEGTSVVRNTTMSGSVRILGNAFVDGGTYSQNAKVQGNAFVVNATMSGNALVGMRARVDNYILSGTVEVGGDVVVYNDQGNCNNGVYYRLTNYYDNKLLECDNRTASHPANSDVNNSYNLFSNATMAPQCQCAGVNTVVVDSMDIVQPSCTNLSSGSVTFHIGNNCGPFTYVWSKGNESGSNLSGLSPGSYSFTITDGLDREGVVPVEIPNPPALTAVVSTTPYDCTSATGGTAKVEVTSGTAPFYYEWPTGEITYEIINLNPTHYIVTVTDALGCTLMATADIQLAGQIPAYLAITSIDCTENMGGGAISIVNFDGTAPYWYQWSNGETTAALDNLSPDTYSVTATDVLGCTFTATAAVGLVGQLQASFSTTPVFCGAASGATTLTPLSGTAPYSFLWGNGATTAILDDLAPGTYAVIATDVNGCEFAGTTEVGISGQLGASLTTTPISCFGTADGTAAISPQGGTAPFAWLWEGGETDSLRNNLAPSDYSVTVSDALGCSNSLQFTLTEPSALALQIAQANLTCFDSANGSASVTATGGSGDYTYQWDNGETTANIDGLIAGDYSVTVSDANGCSETTIVTITAPPMNTLETTVQNNACFGDSNGAVTVAAEGGTPGYTYIWSNQQTGSTISLLPPGTYSPTVTDANGCTASTVVTITSPPALSLETSMQMVSCFGGSDGAASIIADGGTPDYSYTWSNGQHTATITGLQANDYTVTVVDAFGCSAIANFGLTMPAQLDLDVLVDAPTCYDIPNGTATTIVSGGTPDSNGSYSYLWSNGQMDSLANGLYMGIYAVTVTDINGCTVAAGFSVNPPLILGLTTVQTPALICPNDMGELAITAIGGTSPYSYQWDNGTTDPVLVGGVGSYTITITDSNGCTLAQTVEMQEITLSLNALIENASSATTADGAIYLMNIIGGTQLFTYLWSNGSTTLQVEDLLPGDYSVTISDEGGCHWAYSFTVGFALSATGTKQPNLQALIAPNPSSIHAALDFDLLKAQTMTVMVSDVLGRTLQRYKAFFQAGKNSFTLPEGLVAGIYWVILKEDEGGRVLVLRWVVQ